MNALLPLGDHATLIASDPEVVYHEAARLMSRHRMYLPARSGPVNARIQSAPLLHSALLSFEYGVAAEISSEPLQGYSTIHIPIAGRLEVEHRATWHPVGTDAGAVFSHGAAVKMRWSEDLRLLVARIDHQAIVEHLERVLPLTGKPLVFQPFFERHGAGGSVSGAVLSICRALGAASAGGMNPRLVDQMEHMLISSLLFGHQHTYSEEIIAPVALPSPRIVRAVVDHINDRYDTDLTSASLAEAAGVSQRALFDAFRRQFGVSPMRFVRDVRLDRARVLLQTSTHVSVAEVSHAVGFHHPGRFAAQYRARFGESPSQAARRSSIALPTDTSPDDRSRD